MRLTPYFLQAVTLLVGASAAISAGPTLAIQSAVNVVNCLMSHNVPFETSASANWTALIVPYNLRLTYVPAVVTLPYTQQQVSDSVTCAAGAGLKVQAKSGGHSYASYSSGGQDGSLIIDLQNFNAVSLERETGIATVGSGVRLGNLALAIYNQGQRALPHGTCPGVGVGGHFTHGGYGYSSRRWGLALDTIVAMEVVLANGSIIHATPTQYTDIFYAMRGAADSIGIVTFFYLQTVPAPSSVIAFTAYIPEAVKEVATITNAFIALQKIVLDPTIMNGNIGLGMQTGNYGGFTISGWCIECDLNNFRTVTFPKLLSPFPSPASSSVTQSGWIDSLTKIANNEPLSQPLYRYNSHNTFYTKSVVTRNALPLTSDPLTSFWSYVLNQGTNAPSPWYTIIDLYGGAGSQISVPVSTASPYRNGDQLWVFQNTGYTANSQPPYLDSITTFIDGLNNALSTSAPVTQSFGTYSNYVDPYLTPSQANLLEYGADTYNKLLAVKQEVDPHCVFWNPQAIGTVPAFPGGGASIC